MSQSSNTSTFNTENIHIPGFRSLEFPKTPWTRWAGSLGINLIIVSALIVVPLAFNRGLREEVKLTTVSLIDPPHLTPYKPAPAPKLVAKFVPPTPVKAPVRVFKAPPLAVKTALPPAPIEAPKPVEVKPVELAKFEAPKIELPPAPPAPTPVRIVKTGGFGDPNGVPANTAVNHGSMLQKVGAFDMSNGSDHGLASGANGRGKLVASAGFGDGTGAGAVSGNGHGVVHGAGFGEYDAASSAGAHVSRVSATPVQTPVEITYKPKPAYTPEAREKRIEGEVQLEVLFSSAGQIEVIRLVRGLGYGLDENAREAASRIRFHPGTRNGTPVNVTGTVRIVFELS